MIGFILSAIELIISSFFECKWGKSLCLNQDKNNNSTYYDNLAIYFDDLKNQFPNYEFYQEIFIINLLYPILCFFEMVCELLIIYYLHPIYILSRDNIYYFFMRIIFMISKGNYFLLKNPNFYVSELADFLAILGYFIFLQLIELRFCRFDYDLNRNIIKRAKSESNMIHDVILISNSEISSFSEEEDKQQENIDDSLYD